jgi:hypothetical protein
MSLAASVLLSQQAFAQAADPKFWVPNGGASAIAQVGNTIYIGGNFTLIGPASGGGVPTDPSTGAAAASFPKVSGSVGAIIPDGVGGWYIGGKFTSVGGVQRLNLARINADFSVNSWNPNSSYSSYTGTLGYVTSLVLTGSTVWVGGNYSEIGGTNHGGLAAIDAATGAVGSFDAGLGGGWVSSMILNGSSLYLCGGFSTLLGQPRGSIGAFDVNTVTPTAFDPQANERVLSMVMAGSTIYIGGIFTQVGGQTRHHLAEVDATTGALIAGWDPNADDAVQALAQYGGTVYAGGYFNNVGGVFRQSIAAIDGTTGALTPSQPSIGGLPGFGQKLINTLATDGSVLYLGGQFGQINGVERLCGGAIDLGTMTVTAWNPRASQQVFAILPGASYVYMGGIFPSVGAVSRTFVAAIDATTGQPTPWSPNLDASVGSIASDGSRVYITGAFSNINGHGTSRMVALDATTGNVVWDANCFGAGPLALVGSTLYVGGNFNSVGGQPRTSMASVDATTGAVTSWNPSADPNASVMSLAVSGPTVYVGGSFTQMGGQPRNDLAALNVSDGTATAWSPNPDGYVQALLVKGCTVFAGGRFHNVSGIQEDNVAEIDAATGVPANWHPFSLGSNQNILALALAGTTLYIGGDFGRELIAADVNTGVASSWSPNLGALVLSLAISGNTIYAGTYSTFVNDLPQANFAAIDRGSVVDGPYTGCSSGNVMGHVTADCPAAGTPESGITVNAFLTGNSTPTATTATDGAGAYSFLDLQAGNYTIAVAPPAAFSVVTNNQPVTVAGGTSTVDFALHCVHGTIAGHVTADCPSAGTPQLGITVDAFAVGSGQMVASVQTDANGAYSMPNLLAGDYTVSIVLPLDFSCASPSQAATVAGGTTTADFSLHCVSVSNQAKSIGFWMHQFGVATGGNGHADVSSSTLCSYLDLIAVHFNSNLLNPVVVYQPPASGTCSAKLAVASQVLNLQGNAAMIARARQQLMALLLNVAGGYISQEQVISVDGATVSQAITYCDNVIDSPSGNYERAKSIADDINNAVIVPAGWIPLGTQKIDYARGHQSLAFRATPNPAHGVLTFQFSLPKAGPVDLRIFDVAGRVVATLLDGTMEAGSHGVTWDAVGPTGTTHIGMYFARLSTREGAATLRVLQMDK